MMRKLTALRAFCRNLRRVQAVIVLLMVAAPVAFGTTPLHLGIRVGEFPLLSIAGPKGMTCAVEWSDNPVSAKHWSHLEYCVLASGRVEFSDTRAVGAPRRFYRAVQVPASNAVIRLSIHNEVAPVLAIRGPVGAVCQIQCSDDFTDPGQWFHLGFCVLSNTSYKISDAAAPVTPPRYYRVVQTPDTNMVQIPGGPFQMGNTFDGLPTENEQDEVPIHNVDVSPFYLERCEVTKALWDEVFSWATNHGYAFDNAGAGKAPEHPVHSVNWYDAVKWCNARSERDGFAPVYYADTNFTDVYRTGSTSSPPVLWSATGYRLPTEAEWEKAARGGLAGRRFPWSDTDDITHSLANYYSQPTYPFDRSPTRGFHPLYKDGTQPYTSPVGAFAANAYGLYDLAGNVAEWCWDSYESGWYASAGATQGDCRGPAHSSSSRVVRGGSWVGDAHFTRCADRANESQSFAGMNLGFRCVRRL